MSDPLPINPESEVPAAEMPLPPIAVPTVTDNTDVIDKMEDIAAASQPREVFFALADKGEEVVVPEPTAFDRMAFDDFRSAASVALKAQFVKTPDDEYQAAFQSVQNGIENALTGLTGSPDNFLEIASAFRDVLFTTENSLGQSTASLLLQQSQPILDQLGGDNAPTALSLLRGISRALPAELSGEYTAKIITQKNKIGALIAGKHSLPALEFIGALGGDNADLRQMRDELVEDHFSEIIADISEDDLAESAKYLGALQKIFAKSSLERMRGLEGLMVSPHGEVPPKENDQYLAILRGKVDVLKKGFIEFGDVYAEPVRYLFREEEDPVVVLDMLDFMSQNTQDAPESLSKPVREAAYVILRRYSLLKEDEDVAKKTYALLDTYIDDVIADFTKEGSMRSISIEDLAKGVSDESIQKIYQHIDQALSDDIGLLQASEYVKLFDTHGQLFKRSSRASIDLLAKHDSLLQNAFENPEARALLEKDNKLEPFKDAVRAVALWGDESQMASVLGIIMDETGTDPFYFDKFGIDASDTLIAWCISSADVFQAFEDNKLALEILEGQRPGIARTLSGEFGIRNFGRYPEELLIRQFDELTVGGKYGVIAYPRLDHGLAFNNDGSKEAMRTLSQQLGDTKIRITEAGSLFDLMKRMTQLQSKYGKLSFGFLGAHGGKDAMQFGWGKKNEVWTDDVLRSSSAARIHDYFEEGATLVLESCSTGAEEGIGQAISDALKMKVIAPGSTAGGIQRLQVLRNEDQPEVPPGFDIEFKWAQAQQYEQGVLQKSSDSR